MKNQENGKNKLSSNNLKYTPSPQHQLRAVQIKLDKGLEREKIKKEIREEVIKDLQTEKEKDHQSTNEVLSILLKKRRLLINRRSGAVSLGRIKSKINPESQEFKILLKLATSKNYIATYKDLLGNNPTKSNKRNLSFTIRNIKENLCILPKEKAQNKDIIKNIKNYGYCLIT